MSPDERHGALSGGNLKTLVLGAGVIGSFNAARLTEGGQDVTLLARGRRLADLREHGVVLEDARTGRRTTTRVPLIDRIGPEDNFDLAVVIVRRNQIASVLPMLASSRIPNILFLGNNAAGAQDMIDALGRERVLIGMVNAGGERQGHVVRYLFWRSIPLLLGELDGRCTPRTEAIARVFRSARLPARIGENVDAYLKTHAAGLPAFAGALYMVGGDVRQLAHTPDALKLFVEAYREALRALRDTGVPLEPSATRILEWCPRRILLLFLRMFLDTELAVVGGERHAKAAPDEMKELADELRQILRKAGRPSPASDILFAHVEAWLDKAKAARADTPTIDQAALVPSIR